MTEQVLPRVLILEDEPDLREAMVSYLNTERMIADGVGNLDAADAWCRTRDFDILVLDLGLPDGDGLAWLHRAVSVTDKGVIIMTARGLPAQRLVGLRAGADSYLVKPVPLGELALHVRNLFARIRAAHSVTSTRACGALPMAGADWQLHTQTWRLRAPNGKAMALKHAERALLQALMTAAGEVLGKDRVVLSQGGNPDSYDYRRVETLVKRMRQRCREHLDTELPIRTVYGQGLAFTEPGAVVDTVAPPGDTKPRP